MSGPPTLDKSNLVSIHTPKSILRAVDLVTVTTAFAALNTFTGRVNAQQPQHTTQLRYLSGRLGSLVRLGFYGEGAADELGDARIWLLDCIDRGQISAPQWIWVCACEVRFTLGSKAGVAGGLVDENMLWADTIAFNGAGNRLGTEFCRVLEPGTPDQDRSTLLVDKMDAYAIAVELRREDAATSVGCVASLVSGA